MNAGGCSVVPARERGDIFPAYLSTPIEDLIQHHICRKPRRTNGQAALLVGMCIDNRKVLRLPDHFAYVLRTGGASLGRVELYVYCAVAIGSVRAICLIGHDACGMVTLRARREKCIVGLVNNGGWVRGAAEEEFNKHAADFSIDDGAVFVLNEARRLRARYPGERVASLCYTLDDGLLYQCEAEAEVR